MTQSTQRSSPNSDGDFLRKLADGAPVARHAELHAVLAEMKEFAAVAANKEAAVLGKLGASSPPFRSVVGQRLTHAKSQIDALTDDMQSFRNMGRGKFIP